MKKGKLEGKAVGALFLFLFVSLSLERGEDFIDVFYLYGNTAKCQLNK